MQYVRAAGMQQTWRNAPTQHGTLSRRAFERGVADAEKSFALRLTKRDARNRWVVDGEASIHFL